MQSLPNISNPFWKLCKVLKTKPKQIPPLISCDSSGDIERLITSSEKANALGKHFVASHNLGQNIISPFEATVTEGVTRLVSSANDFPENQRITAVELMANIKRVKNMKAPGFDNVLNLELKHMSVNFFNHLAMIFNKCL